MVDTVSKPQTLRVLDQFQEVLVFAVAGVRADNRRQQLANTQVMLVILVVDDVAPGEGRLRQVIGQLFLVERQIAKARYLVAQYLDIGEASNADVERFVLDRSGRFGR